MERDIFAVAPQSAPLLTLLKWMMVFGVLLLVAGYDAAGGWLLLGALALSSGVCLWMVAVLFREAFRGPSAGARAAVREAREGRLRFGGPLG